MKTILTTLLLVLCLRCKHVPKDPEQVKRDSLAHLDRQYTDLLRLDHKRYDSLATVTQRTRETYLTSLSLLYADAQVDSALTARYRAISPRPHYRPANPR